MTGTDLNRRKFVRSAGALAVGRSVLVAISMVNKLGQNVGDGKGPGATAAANTTTAGHAAIGSWPGILPSVTLWVWVIVSMSPLYTGELGPSTRLEHRGLDTVTSERYNGV